MTQPEVHQDELPAEEFDYSGLSSTLIKDLQQMYLSAEPDVAIAGATTLGRLLQLQPPSNDQREQLERFVSDHMVEDHDETYQSTYLRMLAHIAQFIPEQMLFASYDANLGNTTNAHPEVWIPVLVASPTKTATQRLISHLKDGYGLGVVLEALGTKREDLAVIELNKELTRLRKLFRDTKDTNPSVNFIIPTSEVLYQNSAVNALAVSQNPSAQNALHTELRSSIDDLQYFSPMYRKEQRAHIAHLTRALMQDAEKIPYLLQILASDRDAHVVIPMIQALLPGFETITSGLNKLTKTDMPIDTDAHKKLVALTRYFHGKQTDPDLKTIEGIRRFSEPIKAAWNNETYVKLVIQGLLENPSIDTPLTPHPPEELHVLKDALQFPRYPKIKVLHARFPSIAIKRIAYPRTDGMTATRLALGFLETLDHVTPQIIDGLLQAVYHHPEYRKELSYVLVALAPDPSIIQSLLDEYRRDRAVYNGISLALQDLNR